MKDALITIPLQNIKVNPYQPRRVFNEEELEELSQSIQSVGLIHPPLVRKLDGEFYEIIAGERRVRACEKAGIKKINVIVQVKTNLESAELALIENIQRVDLNPIETAAAIHGLLLQSGWTQERIADKVGKKRSTIANYLRLLTLPVDVKEALSKGLITVGHAKVILSLESKHEQMLLNEKIIKEQLTVREAEVFVAKMLQKDTTSPQLKTRNFFLEELTEKLQEQLGTRVEIEERGKRGGRIIIDYYNLDDLDRLLEAFKVSCAD